jgi:hypothetical protein
MKMTLVNFEYGTQYTIGKLFLGKASWYIKQPNKSLPAGTFPVVVDDGIFIILDDAQIEITSNKNGVCTIGKHWAGTDYVGLTTLAYKELLSLVTELTDKGESLMLEIM